MPSLYESTVNTGEVSSSNFTTLYNASGLAVPNAGAGSVTGNLNVGGNLTVQGTSLLIGEVTLQSTLSLPNYTFPLPDGSTDQVLVTDGNGNLYWTDVTAIPGAAYSISATTATGGANITLEDSAGGMDSVKLAAGSNMSIVRTDANTITISTVADNIPDGTADGQVLTWETGAWTATNNIVWNGTTNRTTFTGKNPGLPTGRTYAPAGFVTDTGAIAYSDGDGASLIMGVDSDTQAVKYIGSISSAYGTTGAGSRIAMATTTDSFTSHTATSITGGNTLVFTFAHGFSAGSAVRYNSSTTNGLTQNQIYYVLATGLTTTQCQLSLTQGGSAIALTNGTGLTLAFYNNADTIRVFSADTDTVSLNGTNLILNANAPGVPAVNATISVERGSSGANANLVWNEAGQRWEFNNQVFATGAFVTDADYITINNDNTATNSYFNFTGSGKAIYWDNANSRIATTDKLYVAGNINATGIITIDGDSVSINNDNTATDSYVNFKGFTQYLKWDNTNQRFQFSDPLYISTTNPAPALFERRVTSADVSSNEGKGALRLFERVTDATDNNNDIGGPGIIFGRSYGTSGGTERLFNSIAGIWHGTTTTADMQFNWSNDNFTETSPGVFPGTFTMLRLGSTNAEFLNNSIYVDYTTAGSTKTGINMDTPAHTLDIAGDTNMTGNLIVNTNALFVNAATGRVGVGTNTPGASLDVQGNAQLTGDVAINGGDITTSATTFNLVNTTATTVNLAGAATTVSIGANTGTTTINNSLVTDSIDTADIRATGSVTAGYGGVAPTTLYANGGVTVGGDITINGNSIAGNGGATAIEISGTNITVQGDLGVNGGDITTSQTTASVFNSTATTVNIAGAATAVNIGASTGTTIVNNDFQVHPTSTAPTLQLGSQANFNAVQTTTTATTTTAITATTRNAMNGTVNIHDTVTGAFHIVNFTALRNGATAMLTTYGELYTGSALANFTADISGGSVRLLATPASANSTTFNVVRTSIT